jgi:hypothetical protein
MRTLECFKFEELGSEDIEDKSFTISYSMALKSWVSLHDYHPDFLAFTANQVLSFKDNTVYLHNVKGVKCRYYDDTIHPSHVEFVVVDMLTKLYNNVVWKSQIYKNGVIDNRKTLTSVILFTENRCSGEVPVNYLKTTRNAEGIWKFNDFRDMVKDASQKFIDNEGKLIPDNIAQKKAFFKQSRLYGDYLCVRLIFDNQEQTDLVLSDFNINNRVSPR